MMNVHLDVSIYASVESGFCSVVKTVIFYMCELAKDHKIFEKVELIWAALYHTPVQFQRTLCTCPGTAAATVGTLRPQLQKEM